MKLDKEELLNIYTYHCGEKQVYLHRVIENEYYIKGLIISIVKNATFLYYHLFMISLINSH